MSRFVLPRESTFNINGAPQDGAKLEFFNPGLLTNKDTYSDQALTTANTNPVIADASGRFGSIWMNGDYDVTLKDKNDVLIWGPERVQSNVTNSDAFKLNEDTTATMAADTAKIYVVGDVVETAEFSTGNGGGGTYACVTVGTTPNVDLPNGYNIIVSTADATKCFVLRVDAIVYPAKFGVITGVTSDQTLAWQAVINYSEANANKTIQPEIGVHRIDGQLTFTQGVMVRCTGSQGSTQQFGTTFLHNSNGNLFVWNGNNSGNFGGTGGGLMNCHLLKGNGFNGGKAIQGIATSQTDRPGEMRFDNVLIDGTGTGLWGAGALTIDGTAATTSGSKGVRSINLNKVRVADCNTLAESILINQGTHITGTHVQVDQASGLGAGVKITDDSENVFFSNSNLGDVLVSDNSTNVTFEGGRIQNLSITNTACDGGCSSIITGSMASQSKTFRLSGPSKPIFTGYLGADVANATGNGVNHVILWDDIRVDNFNRFSSGRYRTPSAGQYKVTFGISYEGLGVTAHTVSTTSIKQVDTASAFVTNVVDDWSPDSVRAGGTVSRQMSAFLDCSYNDGIDIVAIVEGGNQDVDIGGTSGGEQKSWVMIEAV